MKNDITRTQKIILWIYVLMGIVSFISLFHPSFDSGEEDVDVSTEKVEALNQQVEQMETTHQIRLTKLEKLNSTLKWQISVADQQRSAANKKADVLRNQLKLLVLSYNTDTTIIKNAIAFDSLATVTENYSQEVEARDSLCNYTNGLLTNVIDNKDSIIENSQWAYDELKSSFVFLSVESHQLADKCLLLQKQLKRKKRNEKIWTGASLLLSGFSFALWLKNT